MSEIQHMQWQGHVIEIDQEGFLRNSYDWSVELAEHMAQQEGIQLSAAHWEIMNYLREYYEDYDIAPPVRMLVRRLAQCCEPDNVNSRYLHQLFPGGPAKQGSRLAGLPKPRNCR